jgi:glutamate synthase domain-containing protein 2
MSLIDNVGLPIRTSLALLVNKLVQYELRDRIKVITSGKLITPVGVAWALATGADFVVSARGFMFSIGCIQALQCNKNTCPTGITTHDKDLQSGLNPEDKAVRVRNYVKNMVYEVGVIAHSCGVNEPRKLRRMHAYIVSPQGRAIPLDELYSPDSTYVYT